jgi:hypothetical protein
LQWPVEHLPRFVENLSDFQSLANGAKASACRHCGRVGTLIGHGFLRGYAEAGSDRIVRAKRFFCSNRGRQRGCGRTDSSFIAYFVPLFTITTLTLWSLFCRMSEGRSAFSRSPAEPFPLCPRSAYRLANRLKRASLRWRSWLLTQGASLASTASMPLVQLHHQLEEALSPQPFSKWQFRLQLSLF